MTLIARPATPGRWLDTAMRLTLGTAKALPSEGVMGVIRYVPLPGDTEAEQDRLAAHDITADELAMLCGLGLGVMLVQHPRLPGWDPRAHSGQRDAAIAAEFAMYAGYPDAHIYLDLEGINGAAEGTITFAESWADRIVQSGFRAGCYVGFDVPLSPEQLYTLRTINSYGSDVAKRHVDTRGCAWQQGRGVTIAGLGYDDGEMRADLLGEVPFACVEA